MFAAIIVTIAVLITLAAALRSGRRGGGLINHRPYNNPYSDASAARDFRGD